MKKIIAVLLILFSGLYLTRAQLPDKNKKEAKRVYNEAVQLIKLTEYESAVHLLDSSMKLDPSFNEALLLKAKTRVEMDDIHGAMDDFMGLTLMDPDNGEPWFYLGYLQFTTDTTEVVLENFNRAISLGFQEYPVYQYRGVYKLISGDYTAAITDLSEAIKRKEDLPEVYHDRATAKRYLGDLQGALYDYRLATNYKHDFPVAFNNMGSVKMMLGDYEGALEDYNVALNLDSGFYYALNNRGTLHYYLGNLEEAIADFDSALAIAPKYIPSMNNKASLMSKINKNEDAIVIFDEIVTIDDSYGRAYLNRGLVKELMGDLEGACEDWNKALELGVEEAAGYVKECN